MNRDLIKKAYSTGRSRGTSLSLGYYKSPCENYIFCQNPNSPGGVKIGIRDEDFFALEDVPFDYESFDMSDALVSASL